MHGKFDLLSRVVVPSKQAVSHADPFAVHYETGALAFQTRGLAIHHAVDFRHSTSAYPSDLGSMKSSSVTRRLGFAG